MIDYKSPEELDKIPHINPDTLQKLRNSTAKKPDFLKEIFQSYITDTETLLKEIQVSIDDNDFDAYYTAVHTLKGLSGTIGCSRIFNLLKIMDKLNKDQNFSQSKQWTEDLNQMFQELKTIIINEILRP
ncbi:MAG: Hpt domain-containing protein [Bacteroidota bacterium]